MKQQSHLIPTILCGGAGTRLWPLSRKHFPKQFTPLPENGTEANVNNLFRQAVKRASLFSPESVVIVCNEAHRFHVAENLHDFDSVDFSILVEPVARNTAPAITLAALDIRQHRGDALMLVLPSDHFVADEAEFSRAVHTAARVAEAGRLVTFGIVPKWPETGYGYIRQGEPLAVDQRRPDEDIYRVAGFQEKPDFETARRWLDGGGYYWNSGMFLFRASVFLQQVQAHAPKVYAACAAAYAERRSDLGFVCMDREKLGSSPDISVDYAVLEHSAELALVPARFGWSDMGSWEALSPLLAEYGDGNRVAGEAVLIDSSDSIIYAQSRLVAVAGIQDCVVVETPDAVLVTRRSDPGNIRRLVEMLRQRGYAQAEEHRKVYRPWGSYESVDAAEGFQVKRIIVNPKQCLSLQLHHRRSEHWVVVRGEVLVSCGEKQFMLGVNESTYIPEKTRHRLENPGDKPAHLVEVQCGEYLGEDDIVRFEDRYGRDAQERKR